MAEKTTTECHGCEVNNRMNLLLALLGIGLTVFAHGETAIAGAILVVAAALNDPKGIHHG